jgi:hypothetical protein
MHPRVVVRKIVESPKFFTFGYTPDDLKMYVTAKSAPTHRTGPTTNTTVSSSSDEVMSTDDDVMSETPQAIVDVGGGEIDLYCDEVLDNATVPLLIDTEKLKEEEWSHKFYPIGRIRSLDVSSDAYTPTSLYNVPKTPIRMIRPGHQKPPKATQKKKRKRASTRRCHVT